MSQITCVLTSLYSPCFLPLALCSQYGNTPNLVETELPAPCFLMFAFQ